MNSLIRVKNVFVRVKADLLDEIPNNVSGLGARSGLVQRIPKISHFLPIELREVWV